MISPADAPDVLETLKVPDTVHLNVQNWTTGAYYRPYGGGMYCAVGAFLAAAGVPPQQLASDAYLTQILGGRDFDKFKYADTEVLFGTIVTANDCRDREHVVELFKELGVDFIFVDRFVHSEDPS